MLPLLLLLSVLPSSHSLQINQTVAVIAEWKFPSSTHPQTVSLTVPISLSPTENSSLVVNEIFFQSCSRANSTNWPSCSQSPDLGSGAGSGGGGDKASTPRLPNCAKVGAVGHLCKSLRTICKSSLSNDKLYMFKLKAKAIESEWAPLCDPGKDTFGATEETPSEVSPKEFRLELWHIIVIAVGGAVVLVLLVVGVACCCCRCGRTTKGFYDVSTPKPSGNALSSVDVRLSVLGAGPSSSGGSLIGSRASVLMSGTKLSLSAGGGSKAKKVAKEFWENEEMSVEVAPIDIVPLHRESSVSSPSSESFGEASSDKVDLGRANPVAFVGDVQLHSIDEEDEYEKTRFATFGFSDLAASGKGQPKSFSQATGFGGGEEDDSGCNSSEVDLESQNHAEANPVESNDADEPTTMVTSL